MDLSLFLPDLVLAAAAIIVFLLDLVLRPGRKEPVGVLSVIGLVVTALAALFHLGVRSSAFGGLWVVDAFSTFFKVFFALAAAAVVIASLDYLRRWLTYPGEYISILMFATLGMTAIASANELLTAYICLELFSFSTYVLAAWSRRDRKSHEAGLKYIILGAMSSAVLLYGISLLYGLFRTTYFPEIAAALRSGQDFGPALWVSLVLVLAGLGFKVSAVPFHIWTPDVYEGAPLPITAYLSIASKTAGFVFLLRFFSVALLPLVESWWTLFAALSFATMFVGNLVAIWQRNIKRLLAYSSISQAGYLLLGLAALTPRSPDPAATGIIFHLAGYGISNMAVFLAVIAFYNLTGRDEIRDLAGLSQRAPFVALALTAGLFSLAGMPLFAGFFTKFYLFTAAAQAGLLWLVGIAVLNSIISLFYYLIVVKEMYITEPREPVPLRVPVLVNAVLFVLVAGQFLVGIYPEWLIQWARAASAVLSS